jgi:hypothetical protein
MENGGGAGMPEIICPEKIEIEMQRKQQLANMQDELAQILFFSYYPEDGDEGRMGEWGLEEDEGQPEEVEVTSSSSALQALQESRAAFPGRRGDHEE